MAMTPNEFVTATNAERLNPRHISARMLRLSIAAFRRHSRDQRPDRAELVRSGFISAVEEAADTIERYERNGTKEFVTGVVYGIFGGVGIVAVITMAMQWLHVGRWP